jgi:hypothetical protein
LESNNNNDEGGEDLPPPILKINVNLTEDMDMVHTTTTTTTRRKSNRVDQQQQHRSNNRTRTHHRTRRNTTTSEQTTKEGAAVQWIQNLQLRSIDGPQQLIAESASSKFLIGDGATTSLAAVLGGGAGAGTTLTTSAVAVAVATPSPTRGGITSTTISSSSSQQQPMSTGVGMMTPEEVVKAALGMPHPLCRSSTIEAGPFTLGIQRYLGSEE